MSKTRNIAQKFDTVKTVLETYLDLLDRYTQSALWGKLIDPNGGKTTWQEDFTMIQLEMQTLYTRLSNHLDYFGHPAGWVPMLSFEVTKEKLSEEVEISAKILYLSYYLEYTADILKNRKDALEKAIQAAEDAIEADAEAFSLALDEVGTLRIKLENLEDRIAQRKRELQEVPVWKTAVKTITTVSSVIPVGQPYVAAAGLGLSTIADVASGESVDPLKIYTDFKEMTSASKNYQQAFENLAASNTSDDERKSARTDVLEHLVNTAKTWEDFGVPEGEVAQELAQLKAQNADPQNFIGELGDLLKEKATTIARLSVVSNAIQILPLQIEQSRLAKTALDACKADRDSVLDQRALDYVQKMKQRAQDRLLRYQYYMVRAYEYRDLQKYNDSKFSTPGQIMEEVKKTYDDLGDTKYEVRDPEDTADETQEGEETPLPSEIFITSFEASYQSQLSDIANKIYTDLINGTKSELTTTSPRITLEESRYDALNAGQPVRINLVDEGLINPSEETLRIVDIWVDSVEMYDSVHKQQYSIQCSVDENCWASGNNLPSGSVQIDIRHSGISKLQSNGQTYKFWHANEGEDTSPFLWRSKIYTETEEIIQDKRSAAQASLIASLINKTGVDTEKILLYTRPALWSDLIITKSGDEQYQITRLGLRVKYDYYSMPSTLVKLDVMSEGIREDGSSEAIENGHRRQSL